MNRAGTRKRQLKVGDKVRRRLIFLSDEGASDTSVYNDSTASSPGAEEEGEFLEEVFDSVNIGDLNQTPVYKHQTNSTKEPPKKRPCVPVTSPIEWRTREGKLLSRLLPTHEMSAVQQLDQLKYILKSSLNPVVCQRTAEVYDKLKVAIAVRLAQVYTEIQRNISNNYKTLGDHPTTDQASLLLLNMRKKDAIIAILNTWGITHNFSQPQSDINKPLEIIKPPETRHQCVVQHQATSTECTPPERCMCCSYDVPYGGGVRYGDENYQRAVRLPSKGKQRASLAERRGVAPLQELSILPDGTVYRPINTQSTPTKGNILNVTFITEEQPEKGPDNSGQDSGFEDNSLRTSHQEVPLENPLQESQAEEMNTDNSTVHRLRNRSLSSHHPINCKISESDEHVEAQAGPSEVCEEDDADSYCDCNFCVQNHLNETNSEPHHQNDIQADDHYAHINETQSSIPEYSEMQTLSEDSNDSCSLHRSAVISSFLTKNNLNITDFRENKTFSEADDSSCSRDISFNTQDDIVTSSPYHSPAVNVSSYLPFPTDTPIPLGNLSTNEDLSDSMIVMGSNSHTNNNITEISQVLEENSFLNSVNERVTESSFEEMTSFDMNSSCIVKIQTIDTDNLGFNSTEISFQDKSSFEERKVSFVSRVDVKVEFSTPPYVGSLSDSDSDGEM